MRPALEWRSAPTPEETQRLIDEASRRDFPGNVRDLESFLCNPEDAAVAPAAPETGALEELLNHPAPEAVRRFRMLYAQRAVDRAGGVERAAEEARLSRSTFSKWLHGRSSRD